MIVTEEEAKTKRCCENFGHRNDLLLAAPCIGSVCMAWRWLDQTSYIEGHDEPRESSLGYCGKAGRP